MLFDAWLIMLAVDVLGLSVLTFVVYAWDKRQSARGGWRVPEQRLHLLSLLGGWPGALLAQAMIRHKTLKRRFRVVFWLTVIGHLVWASGVTYLVWRFGASR